jgi:hypothetical protein
MVKVLDHQFDDLGIIAGVIRGLRAVSHGLELDDTGCSFLWLVSIARKHITSAVSTYSESAALEGSHEVLRLAAENSSVEIEAVRSAKYFAIRECLRVVEPGGKAKSVWRFSKIQGSLEVGIYMAKPAFSTLKVLIFVLFDVRGARCCKLLRQDEDRGAVTLYFQRRLVANLRAHRLASSAAAQVRPVRVVLLL